MTMFMDETVLNGILLEPAELPEGMRQHVIWLTPELATALLNANEKNRLLDQSLAMTYARQMNVGDWPYTGDPIHVGPHGELLNGQHRCRAVEMCGMPILATIILGLNPKFRANLDSPRVRKAGDDLRMDDDFKQAQTCGSAARLLLRWGFPDRWTLASSTYRPSRPEVVSFARAFPEIQDSATLGYSAYMKVGIRPSVITAVHFRLALIDPERAEEFMHYVTTGENMKMGNPILALRGKMIRHVSNDDVKNQNEQLWYAVDAWNKWVSREAVKKLQLPSGGVTMKTLIQPTERIQLVPDEDWSPRRA